MRTVSLSGEVRLDGGVSEFEIDLHSLSSDQANRDRYVRSRMFGRRPHGDVYGALRCCSYRGGSAEGLEVETQVEGSLEIRGITVPLVFDIEARDDGDRVVISGQDDVYVAAAGHYATEGRAGYKYRGRGAGGGAAIGGAVGLGKSAVGVWGRSVSLV